MSAGGGSGRSPVEEPEAPLFLAFADGAFHYVCAECTAICCRGQGFGGSLRREMPALLSRYPALGRAATWRQGDVLFFKNAAPRCYFLDQDNLCRIEKEDGRALKPGMCTLFPFNVFTRIGRTVAVSPHFLCPLRLQSPPRPGEVAGTHSTVAAAVRESGLLDRGYLESAPPAALHASQGARAVLKREEAFRDLCARGFGQRRFFETLQEASTDARALSLRTSRGGRVLGLDRVPESRERDGLDDLFLALAPPLRLSMLSLSSEAILAALALGERLARKLVPLGTADPTLQMVHNLVTSFAPALMLLALGDEPMPVPEGDVTVAALGSPELSLAAYVAVREGRAPAGTLAALEVAIPPSMSVADRSVLLNYLGSEVAHVARTRRYPAPAAVGKRPRTRHRSQE